MKGGKVTADSPLIVKSKAFSLEVIQVCKELRVAKCESALINQFLRSGTSIGANIREAFYAHGKADFIDQYIPPPQPKKFLGLVPRIFFYLFTFHSSLFTFLPPQRNFFEVISNSE